MTDYFEVHAWDGPARLGELRLADPIVTPTLVGDRLVDLESEWVTDRDIRTGSDTVLTLLPHRGFPAGTDERVQHALASDHGPTEYPSAVVITPATADDHDADAYLLSTAQGITGHASAFTDAIIATRTAIPPDTALMLSGVATPRNLATLVYAGVDLVDTHRAVIRGTQGKYLTVDGEYHLDTLDELPCTCTACSSGRDGFTRTDCITHNVTALEAAIAGIRNAIRDGRLRDYLEAQARHTQWCTSVLRELDQEYAYLEEHTPVARRTTMTAASEDTLRRVEIQRFADRVTTRYQNRLDHPLVLVPCSARKPYRTSQSHKQFRDAIRWRAHVVSLTSPIGIVPQELELTYPAQHYDSVVTGRWTATEVEFVTRVLSRYLSQNPYPRIIAHVPPEGYAEIVRRATTDLDVPVEYTVTDHPTNEPSLTALAASLTDQSPYDKHTGDRSTVLAIADYQFGEAAGAELFGDAEIRGRFPRYRVFSRSDEQLAALVPEYGLLALSLAGAEAWHASAVPSKTVRIDNFVPHGSVLAPGVTEADSAIRVGEEVIVEGPRAFAVGRAAMSGSTMTGSTRGVAVDIRHVLEQPS